jgi:hypothetical protein
MPNLLNTMLGGGESKTQKGLINDCLNNHKACRIQNIPSFLPSRLIDVRLYPKLRLVCTQLCHDNSTEDQRYIALSYCWGPSMPEEGKTTSKNLDARLKSIDFQELPKTLRDAISFTHSLSIPFLWIDALCILQGDEADWEQESSMMSQVYSNALATVAAAASDHCQGGFLEIHYSKKDLPVPRRWEINMLTQTEDPNPWVDSFFQNPLHSRGWTLQERELSPRMLHFTRMHVVWECRERVCAYIRPQNKLSAPKLEPLNLNHWSAYWQFRCFDLPQNRERLTSISLPPSYGSTDFFEAWRKMVEDYSQRRFTVAADKVAGIAGLADMVQTKVKCDYLAGIWRNSLVEDLLWRRAGPQIVHSEQDSSKYYAPSWSWASTNFPIKFETRGIATDAEIIEASVTPEGAKRKLLAGFIRLRAKVFNMPVNTTSAILFKDIGDGSVYRPTSEPRKEVITVCVLKIRKTLDETWVRVGEQPLGEGYYRGGGLGLILHPIENAKSTYKRTGLAELVPFERFENLEYQDITIV